jgi:hypothetical protein
LTLVQGLLYAFVIPPWQAPDETGHFEYAWLVADLGRLPHREDVSPAFEQELLGSLYEWRYGDYIGRPLPEGMPARLDDLPQEIFAKRSRTVLTERFSLSYLWQALFLLPVRSQDLTWQLYAARLSSVLINVVIVWLAYKIFAELAPQQPGLVLAMTAVVVLLPQHTFINGMVGDGPLAELMAGVVFYGWALIFRRGANMWTILAILLGTVLAAGTKATAYFLIPLNAGLAIWWLVRRRRRLRLWEILALICVGLALLAGVAWFWLEFSSGSGALQDVARFISPESIVWTDSRGLSVGQALLSSHDSFWANFGWMNVPVSGRWYGALLLLSGLALTGWLVGQRSRELFPRWAVGLMAGVFFTALAVFVLGPIFLTSSGYYQFQGRYLFPVTVPAAFLLVAGWAQLMPAGRRTVLLGLVVALLAFFDLWSILVYIVPYYYG